MRKHAISTLIAVMGFTLSLLALGPHAYARENPLLDEDFWRTATVEDVAKAIAEGADLHARGKGGETPLHLASWANENPAVAGLLLDHGADLHARGKDGETPLHDASWANENPAVAGLLLDRGADLHARDKHGLTPLHLASARNENPEMVVLLLNLGANATAQDKLGKTPFDWARENEHMQNSKAYWRLNELKYQ